MSKKFLIIGSVLLIVGLIGLVWFLGPKVGIEVRSIVDFESRTFASCGKDVTLFTESPIEMNKLTSIRPLGSLDPLDGRVFPADRVYLMATNQEGAREMGKSGEVKVYSPGDVQVTKAAYIEYKEGDIVVDKDYSLYFKPCREVEGVFHHIKSLSPILRAQLENKLELVREDVVGRRTQNRFEAKIDMVLRAGDLIGEAGGTLKRQAFDFRMVDERVTPHEYANSERWEKSQKYVVCPFDYYSESLKEKFMALMGNGKKQRSEFPVCGLANQDIKGTVQGVWFTEKTKETYPEDPHLALVHDEINSSKPVFSVGGSMEKSGLPAGLYYFGSKKTGVINRDFGEVDAAGKIYCYQGLKNKWGDKIGKVIMVELADDNTMRMETRAGLSCVGIDWAFSDRMTVFER